MQVLSINLNKQAIAGLITIIVVTTIHLGCFAVFWTGISWAAVIACIALYLIRGFGITGGYHRYFSHRSYKTGRPFQFLLALLGCSAVQGTPLEWTRNHRHHHRHSDTEKDIHSPRQSGFWWAHLGWMLTMSPQPVNQRVQDLEKFPELRMTAWLQVLVIGGLVASLYWCGESLGAVYNTSGIQFVVWGFFISTVCLWHMTYSINSLTHIWGKQRYKVRDDSRNSFLLGIVALGEGWHNNHHRYPSSARQGFFWWEIDLTYYELKVLSWLGLIWDLRQPPAEAYATVQTSPEGEDDDLYSDSPTTV